nr:MotA/TolQ/ExbB proton channel family protein [Caballeronia sp. INDeC2]
MFEEAPVETYGMSHVWSQGDFVTRGIALTLLIMSVLTWTVIVIKGVSVMRLKRLARNAERAFRQSGDVADHIRELATDTVLKGDNPFRALVLAGEAALELHHQSQPHLHDRLDVSDWIARSLHDTMDDWSARMQRGLAILASIGSTAPFVGLFGTVWGIYHALVRIGVTGQTSIDQVAGPVGESLIMTAFGLFVAIPAVLGYNALVRANGTLISRLNRFSHGIHAVFVTGSGLASARQ